MGDHLPIVKQMQVQVSRKARHGNVWVQIQKDAPVDFLLGTDLQPLLGLLVSIVSLNCLLNVLLSRKAVDQTIEGWIQEITSRMKPTAVALKSYSGGSSSHC